MIAAMTRLLKCVHVQWQRHWCAVDASASTRRLLHHGMVYQHPVGAYSRESQFMHRDRLQPT